MKVFIAAYLALVTFSIIVLIISFYRYSLFTSNVFKKLLDIYFYGYKNIGDKSDQEIDNTNSYITDNSCGKNILKSRKNIQIEFNDDSFCQNERKTNKCPKSDVYNTNVSEITKNNISDVVEIIITRFSTSQFGFDDIRAEFTHIGDGKEVNIDNDSSKREHNPVKKGIILKIVYDDEQAAVDERESGNDRNEQ